MSNVIENINTALKEEATKKHYNFLVVATKVERNGFLDELDKEAYVDMQYQIKNLTTDKLSEVKSINNIRRTKVKTSIGLNFNNWEKKTSEQFIYSQMLINESDAK